MARGGGRRAQQHSMSIKDMLKIHSNTNALQTTSILNTQEDYDLRMALQLSKEEQVNEQKRILEQFARLSQQQQEKKVNKFQRKKRLIQKDDSDEDDMGIKNEKVAKEDNDEEDQWFQTVSSRPQQSRIMRLSKSLKKAPPKSRKKKTEVISIDNEMEEKDEVKKEPEKNEVLLDVDDLAAFLTKEEPMIEEESYDLTSLLNNQSDTEEDEAANAICQPNNNNNSIEDHASSSAECRQMISDSDSDCSIIDLVEEKPTWINENNNEDNNEDIPQSENIVEDDGYLSPLEGFTSLNDVRNDASFNPYFEQFTPSMSATTAATATTTTRKRKSTGTRKPGKKIFFNRKKYWAKKKK